jgi:hypothetical protein
MPKPELDLPFWWRRLKSIAKDLDNAGIALAVLISWERHHSIIVSALCGIAGWVYLAYLAITGGIPHAL